MGTRHSRGVGTFNHPITSNPNALGTPYANIAARDADTTFHSNAANLRKVVAVTSPLSLWALMSNTPTWLEMSSTSSDEYTELLDTPSSITAFAVQQGNAAGTALENGQNLTATGSPTLTQLTVGNAGLIVGTSTPFSDSSGTLTLQNIDAIDGTTENTFESEIDSLSNLTTVGALNAGSITSGFGIINNGASAITTTGLISGGTLSVTGTITGPSGTWDSSGVDIATGSSYAINSTDVLTNNTLGSGVVNSSLTSVGTLDSLTVTGDLTVDTDTFRVDASDDNVIIGNSATGLTDLTIFQGSNSTKGLTLSGVGVTGSSTTEGVSLIAGNLGAGNNQLWFVNTVDQGSATKNSFRGILGIDIPTFNGVNNTGITGKNIGFGGEGSGIGVAVGFSSTAVQNDVDAKVHIKTAVAGEIGLIVDATASQTADLFQTRDSSDTVLTVIDADGNLGVLNSNPSVALDVTGSAKISSNLTVTGNLTVSGTTTTLDTATLLVEDKNIELGTVATPSDTTADGGGWTLKGDTDKTIIWDNTNDNWTSNQSWNLLTGLVYKINNTSVLSSTTLGSGITSSSLTSVGTLGSLTVTGDLTVDTTTLFVDSTNNKVGMGIASSLQAQAHIQTGSASEIGLIIQASSSQTGNTFQIRNSSGTVESSIDASGNMAILGSLTAGLGVDVSSQQSYQLNGDDILSDRLGATGAAVDVGGTSYTVGDDITLVDGNFTAPAVFNVDTESGGVVQTVSVVTAGGYISAPSNPVSTTGGTGTGCTLTVTFSAVTHTLENITLLDSATKATIEGVMVTLSNLTAATSLASVGALNSGSITSGFGSINNGASSITTTGTISGGTIAGTLSTAAQTNITSLGTLTSLTIDNIVIDGNDISTSSGNLTLTPVSGSSVVIDGGASFDGTVLTGLTALTSTAITGTLQTAAQTNITSVGALNSGSIASGFGNINIGSSTFTTTGTINGPSGSWGSGGIDISTQIKSTKSGTDGDNSAFLVEAAQPSYAWKETDAGTDEKTWDINCQGGIFEFNSVTDANDDNATWMRAVRTGNGLTVTSITWIAATTNIGGNIHVDGDILLGNVDGATDATADGLGVTLKGTTNKTILWNNATDRWIFNQGITISSGDFALTGAFRDTSGDVGTSGQVLSSTVSGTNWITAGVGTVTNTGTLTNNSLVRGNGSADIDVGNITMSSDGNSLTIPSDLTVDTDTLFVDSANDTVQIGGTDSITDLTIFQQSTTSKKGFTLSGLGVGGSNLTADGFVLVLGNSVVGNMQLWMGQQSDVGDSAKVIFRLFGGAAVPSLGAVSGNGAANRHFNLGNPDSKVGVGFDAIGAIQADVVGQLHVLAKAANIGLIVQASASQTADLLQIRDSADVVLTHIDEIGALSVVSTSADTSFVTSHQSTGTNGGTYSDFVTDRDPNVNITGAGGDVVHRSGTLPGTYEYRVAGTELFKRSVLPAAIFEINTDAEYAALFTAGSRTVSVDTTIHFNIIVSPNANVFVMEGTGSLIQSGRFSATVGNIYSGTGNYISGTGSVTFGNRFTLVSTSTGTLTSQTGGTFSMAGVFLSGWDDLGTTTNTNVFVRNIACISCTLGFKFIDPTLMTFLNVAGIGVPMAGPLITVSSNLPTTRANFNVVTSTTTSTGSVLKLDTRINSDAILNISNSFASSGNLFEIGTASDATINSVADGSIAAGSITAQTASSGGTTHSSTTTYFEDEVVVITGTTSYNGTFPIFNVVAGVSFDTTTAFVADDATGTVNSERLAITLAGGHGITTGTSNKIIGTNFYNGFSTALNVATNVLTINGDFISTNTGTIQRDRSLDQSDRRVMAESNEGISDSHFIVTAFVNNNSTANGAIVNNTFTDMVFGTVGSALIAGTTMERWRMINELNGTFEYIGAEPFDGLISFDFTVESSGGTVDFRFKWQKDTGSGFVDLPDDVESLVAVGSDAQSVTKMFPLAAVEGDKIKPQITRNSGSSGITTVYATNYATQ